MTTIHLGPNSTAPCNLEALIETRLLLTANSGAGKSWAIRRLLEQTHGKVQHMVLDIEGDFGSLRERFAYALVGPDGDCPADPRTAGPLAVKLLELGVSAIADISELTEPERDEFAANFLQGLMAAPKRLWRPLLAIVDEAHKACPEGRNTLSKPHVIDLMTRGRKRAFGAVLATQRVALLANTAIAEANNKLVGRCTLDTDIKRIAEDVGFDKATRRELRTLQPGEFYAFGPALSAEVQRVRIGEVVTTHPRPGTTRSAALPPAPKALASALAELAKLVPLADTTDAGAGYGNAADGEYVEALNNEIASLRARVAELEAQPALTEDHVHRLEAAVAELHTTGIHAVEAARSVMAALPGRAQGVASSSAQVEQDAPRSEPKKAAPAARIDPSSAHAKRPDVPGKEGLSKCARGLLTALYQHGDLSLVQAAIIACYAPDSGGVRNAAGELRSGGFAEGSNARLHCTAAGAARVSDAPRLPTGRKLAEYWYAKLDRAERLILGEVVAAYPKALSLKDAASSAGYEPTSGGVRNAAGRLRTLELVRGGNAGMTADRRLV